jgi:hypothetical protein
MCFLLLQLPVQDKRTQACTRSAIADTLLAYCSSRMQAPGSSNHTGHVSRNLRQYACIYNSVFCVFERFKLQLQPSTVSCIT